MNFSVIALTIPVLVFLVGPTRTVSSSPVCPESCNKTKKYDQQHFRHVSNLNSSSAAPWHLHTNKSAGRKPQSIQYAVCQDCTVKHMDAKPIYVEIAVYQMISNGSNYIWCKCPYSLAVGCTCVQKQ